MHVQKFLDVFQLNSVKILHFLAQFTYDANCWRVKLLYRCTFLQKFPDASQPFHKNFNAIHSRYISITVEYTLYFVLSFLINILHRCRCHFILSPFFVLIPPLASFPPPSHFALVPFITCFSQERYNFCFSNDIPSYQKKNTR